MRLIIDIEADAMGARIEYATDAPPEAEMAGRLARALAAVVQPAPAVNGSPVELRHEPPDAAGVEQIRRAASRLQARRRAKAEQQPEDEPAAQEVERSWDDREGQKRELQRLRDEESLSIEEAAKRVGVSVALARQWDGEPS